MDATWIDTARLAPSGPPRSTPPDPADDTTTVDLLAARIRLRSVGTGSPTLVIAPDPPNVIEHHAESIALLSPFVRTVCFEMPGFGLSRPRRGFRFTIADNAGVLIELLEHLGSAPYVLALPCVSGLVAIEAARRRPDLVERLIVVQTADVAQTLRWVRRVDRRGIIATPYVGQLVVGLGKRRLARPWYEAALADRAQVDRYVRLAQAAFDRGASYCLASAFQALRRAKFGPEHDLRLAQPAVCLWGLADRTHRKTDRRSVLEYLPDARMVEWSDAGHFPDLEQPQRFRDLVAEFLGRTPRAS